VLHLYLFRFVEIIHASSRKFNNNNNNNNKRLKVGGKF